MPEEAQEAPVSQEAQDTPSPETPDTPQAPEATEQQTQAEIDYEKRYNDLRPEFDRKSEEAAQYRQIIELAQQGDAQALELLGLEAAQDTEQEDRDPDEPLTRAEFEQYQAQLAEERQAIESQEAFLVDVNSGIEEIEDEIGRTLSDQETQFILAQTEAQLRSGGQLDVKSAYAPIEDMSKAAVDRYLESKKQAQAAPLGAAGSEQHDLSTEEGRRKAAAQVAEASLASEG